MKPVKTDKAPIPNGHYSQAVVVDNTAYLSFQLPIDPHNPDKPPGAIEDQTGQVLNNILEIVKVSGGAKDNIAKVTIYVTDISDWAKVNTVYENFMGAHKPARGVVQVAGLHLGYSIALDVIAVL